ncbi:type III secretion apparatus protein OrgA/MxiK [Martelella alba]|uniref:Type III secretion apparatus protein OrgA/MxiK n=1 Tax=Martelella alba TaxID=2590451 RepID=A0ABY2SFV6_9HYPH|nr:type III secretion apparatus protein OrgA/MxiK [Martelella alba]TKI02800.1 type III secretion apparatus protein OrgA/MxiK [Martelella alba]
MKSPSPLDSLLFDPLSWMHPRCLLRREGFDGVRSRALINGMIIRAYGWSVERPVLTADRLMPYFVGLWRYLPHVALLIAAQRHRAVLSRRGRLRALPGWVRQFAERDIVASAAISVGAADGADILLEWGKNELIAYGEQLPLPIRQRIPLAFPPDMARESAAGPPADPCPLLIRLAFQHAKRHSDTPNAAEFRRCFD